MQFSQKKEEAKIGEKNEKYSFVLLILFIYSSSKMLFLGDHLVTLYMGPHPHVGNHCFKEMVSMET